MTVLVFVLAAACGVLLRVGLSESLNGNFLPWGTLLNNAAGSLALGVVAGWSEWLALILGVALLGSLTTFSTFAVETTTIWNEHRRMLAASYVLLTTALAVGGAWAGLVI